MFYITKTAFLTISQVELIIKKMFTKVVLDKNIQTFVIYISSLSLKLIHLRQRYSNSLFAYWKSQNLERIFWFYWRLFKTTSLNITRVNQV